MTDKQKTSNDYIFELNEMCIDCISEIDECECRKIAENLHFKLYRKEQECEAYKMEAEEGKEINAELKAENEELKKRISGYKCPMRKNADYCGYLEESGLRYVENEFLKQILAEIKPILELYANSKVGEEQSDGTYKLSGGIFDSFGFYTTTYDPRPAREGLKKISEVKYE